ncbi:MAG TPA: hypothetical protein VMT20_29005 [Terriglobia bacterium]|nr:hypothetical protein [Terriglobia bacterium]
MGEVSHRLACLRSSSARDLSLIAQAAALEVRPMKGIKGRVHSSTFLLPLALLAGTLPLGAQATKPVTYNQPGAHSQDSKGGFGKPETIVGTLTLVNPQEGLVILMRRGPGEPASTQLSGTETMDPRTHEVVKTDTVKATPGPGETDYSFRITTHSLIKIGHQRVSLADLTQFQDKPATVYFIPERSGNFVLGLDVSE